MKVENIEAFFKQLQDSICVAIENTDASGQFKEDLWEHHSGGGGRTRLIQNNVRSCE